VQGTFEDRVKRAFAGKYDVGEELGRGGMAVVYHAVDPADGSEVAVKVLRPEFTASIASERWIREIELARSLDHPGILPFLETGEADGLLYIVMPVVKGGSLKEKLQGGQLPVEESLSIASEVADALAHAHVQGIVHRDIKPANILFGQNQVYVADFGMAKATTIAGGEELTESGVAVGTPAYMSPEQAAANPRLDGRSDIYSLGCVLFEMLVGDPPFTGPTAQVIIARQLQERPPSVRVVRPSVPEEVEHLVSRSLAKSAADRFKDSAEFAREMRRLAGGDYSRQIRVFNHDVSRRDLRKVAGFGVLAGLLLATLMGWWINREPVNYDARRVVVFPTIVTDSRVGAEVGWASNFPFVISRQLEGSDLSGLDGWTWLDSLERVNPPGISDRRYGNIAKQQDARYYVTVRVQPVGEDSFMLRVNLTDVTRVDVFETVSETGRIEESLDIAIRASARLQAHIAPSDRLVDRNSLEERNPEALAEFFEGERAYREGHFDEAQSAYERAVAIDSGFAIAALRGAHAAFWTPLGWTDANNLLNVSLRTPGALTNSVQFAMAQGFRAFLDGDAELAQVHFLTARDIDDRIPEVWTALGELYSQLLPFVDRRDSLARDAYEKAFELDPGFVPALYHLQIKTLQAGDLERARDLYRTYAASRPDSVVFTPVRLMLECIEMGPEGVEWDQEVSAAPTHVLFAGRALGVGGRYPECSRAALESVVANDTTEFRHAAGAALGTLLALAAHEGREEDVRRQVDSLSTIFPNTRELFVFYSLGGGNFREEASALVNEYAKDLAALPFLESFWPVVLWGSHIEDAELLEATLDELGNRRLVEDRPYVQNIFEIMIPVAATHLAFARGDTVEAVRRFTELRPLSTVGTIYSSAWWSLGAEYALLADLLLATGKAERALEIALNIAQGTPMAYLVYLKRSLVVVQSAAGRTGDSDLEVWARERLADIN